MKRRAFLSLLASPLLLTPSLAAAQNTVHPSFKTKEIVLNGHMLSKPSGFVYSGTTYMPIYYLEALLTQLDIKYSWNGTTFSWTLPPGMKLSTTKFTLGKSDYRIVVNGTTVATPPVLVANDPSTKKPTSFMPIWYLFSAFKAIGLTVAWNSGTELVVTSKIPLFVTSTKSGTTLKIGYYTEMDALAALSNDPGGHVKDLHGNTVATESDYAAFTSPAVTNPKEFTSLTSAANAISGTTSGYVVDLNANRIVKEPSIHYVLSGGLLVEVTANGSTPLGTQVPSFMQSNELYAATSQTQSGSPYLTEFYRIGTLNGSSWKYQSPTYVGNFENSFRTVDLTSSAPTAVTASQINTWLTEHESFLSGLGSSFLAAQQAYGVNATYLLSHAYLESGGTHPSSFATLRNNLYGYNALTTDPNLASTFPSDDYAIQFQAWAVKNNYLNPNGSEYYNSPTLDGMNMHYSSDPNWAAAVASVMDQYVHDMKGSASDYTQYSGTPASSTGLNSQEPVYYIQGVTGTAKTTPYGALPVYGDLTTGSTQMFSTQLGNGSSGNAVLAMQEALNSQGAGLKPDGMYGPNTAAAVEAFQSTNGLPATGVCDIATWEKLFPVSTSISSGTSVQIDEIAEANFGDNPVEWLHVTGANGVSGWVVGSDVQFTNVYRVQAPASGTSVTAVDASHGNTVATLRSGDTVAVLSSPDSKGYVEISFNNSAANASETGYVLKSDLESLS